MWDELNLEVWKKLSANAQEGVAQRLAGELPEPFHLLGIQPFAMGGQEHSIALFEYQQEAFCLIPGASVSLGYDPDRPFEPTPEQAASWQQTRADFGLAISLHEYLLELMTPLRSVNLGPFLLEVAAKETGVEVLSYGDSLQQKEKGQVVRFKNPPKGQKPDTGCVYSPKTHRDVIEDIRRTGFRLPTSDEWEYACGAGARTLFRWGNDCPTDCYPSDACGWDEHRKPNAFGLHIAEDPYKNEAVLEPEIVYRGGDGGGAICGGSGFLSGWLTLASPYYDRYAKSGQEQTFFGLHARRLFPIDF